MMEPGVTMETFITSSIVVFMWIFPEGSSLNISCDATTNCTDTDNSWCRDGFCECQPGFKDIGDHCRPRMIHDGCSDSSDCSNIPRSLCLNDICLCLPGYASNENNSTCEARKLSDSCKIDSDCSSSVANSRCDSSGICTCLLGYMPDTDVCVRRRLNDSCVHRRDCTEVMNNTQCLRGVCACAKSYIEHGDDECRMRRLGDSCSRSVECNIAPPEVRVCKEGKCSCDKAYRQIRDNSCEKIILGSPCGKAADCLIITHSKCLNKTCRCDTRLGYKNGSDNTTCKVRELGDACAADEECQNIANSACADGICSCLIGHRENKEENDTKSSCKLNVIGDSCKSKQDCMLNNSACVRNTCSCVRGFTSVNGSECRLKTLHETSCSKHRECLEFFNNSVCNRSGRCECRRQYAEQDDGLTCQFRYLGDSCVDNSNCLYSVQKSECWNSVCRCLSTHLASSDNTKCQIKMIGGAKCGDNTTCSVTVPHSFCNISANDTCQCGVGYYRNENFNICLDKRLKDTCATDEECTTTNTGTFCSPETGTCECIPGFIETFLNGTDLRPSSSISFKPFCEKRRIGEHACDSSTDCSAAIANSTCGICSDAPDASPCRRQCVAPDSSDLLHFLGIDNSSSCTVRACTCSKGFVTSKDRTRCEGRKLRETCIDDQDCSVTVPDAVCMETRRICFCRHGYREAGPDVCTRRTIGDHCTEQIDCESAVPFSNCHLGNMNTKRNGECVCNSGYHSNNNNTRCRKRQIGDRTCVVDTDCSDAVNNSRCHRGMCVCERGHSTSPDHKHCRKRRLHADYCETSLDCTPAINNSVCVKHRCDCLSGYYSRGEDECVQRQIGDNNCRIDSDCFDAVNNSECMSGACTCVSGFVVTDANICRKRKLFDGICSNHVDCADAVEHSWCHNSSCVCVIGFYSSTDRTACHKRRLNDSCSTTRDCSSAIRNSNCSKGGQCACLDDHDPHDNNSLCVPRPKMIGQRCYSMEQCQMIDHRSSCNETLGRSSECVCSTGTFVAQNRSSCVPFPAAIGDHCLTNDDCTRKLNNTFCGQTGRTCRCKGGYYVDNGGLTCHREPSKLGDACQIDAHCTTRINMSKCDVENRTCVCGYGFEKKTFRSCVQRPRLPEFKPLSPPNVPVHTKDGSRDSKCPEARSHCSQLSPSCCCEYRHARPYNSSQCVPTQTYTLVLHLKHEAELYDYVPLHFQQDYMILNESSSQMLADKITLTGLMAMFTSPTSSLRDRYVASEVTGFTNPSGSNETTDQGVIAKVLLHLKADYFDATPTSELYAFMAESLTRTTNTSLPHQFHGNLGDSMLKVGLPFKDSVVFTDYDECATKSINDCSDYSTCINTLGSFMCVCFSSHDDLSKSQNRQLGRLCVIRTTTDDNSAVCSSDNCENNWHFVGLAVALFLLTVMIFIVYEIIQRKQTFTARKLYEKFGTTKIRKLRQASMKRMQERKKRKQEETKRQKEEEKQKKEELKRQKSEEKRLKEEEKKQQDMEKKNLKKAKKKRKPEDEVEWVEEPGEDDAAGRASPVEFIHQTSSPFSVISIEENVDEDDRNSLPDDQEEEDTPEEEELEINTEIVSDLPESPV